MQTINSLFKKKVLFDGKIFTIWRSLFGFYFIYYAIRMLPYASEIYSRGGIVPSATLNWTYGLFPDIFYFFDSPQMVVIAHICILVAGGGVLFGYFPRVACFIIFYLQTALYNRNVLTDDPSMAFIGLLLLTLVLIPHQPKLLSKEKGVVRIPYFVFFVPIFVFCVAFTTSAIDKISSPSWLQGTALFHMLHLSVARDTSLVHFFVAHQRLTELLSYSAVLVQLTCFPFFIAGLYRVALILNFLAFCFIFLVLDLNQVIYGMLLFYSFFLLRDIPEWNIHIKSLHKYLKMKW